MLVPGTKTTRQCNHVRRYKQWFAAPYSHSNVLLTSWVKTNPNAILTLGFSYMWQLLVLMSNSSVVQRHYPARWVTHVWSRCWSPAVWSAAAGDTKSSQLRRDRQKGSITEVLTSESALLHKSWLKVALASSKVKHGAFDSWRRHCIGSTQTDAG